MITQAITIKRDLNPWCSVQRRPRSDVLWLLYWYAMIMLLFFLPCNAGGIYCRIYRQNCNHQEKTLGDLFRFVIFYLNLCGESDSCELPGQKLISYFAASFDSFIVLIKSSHRPSAYEDRQNKELIKINQVAYQTLNAKKYQLLGSPLEIFY